MTKTKVVLCCAERGCEKGRVKIIQALDRSLEESNRLLIHWSSTALQIQNVKSQDRDCIRYKAKMQHLSLVTNTSKSVSSI